MPYYQRFKYPHSSNNANNKRKATNYRHHHTRASLHYNSHTHRFRSASKHSAVNPLVIRLAIIILVFALLFGFIKSGASNIGRLIKIGNKDKSSISSIETSADLKSNTSNEESMNILRDLSFQIFAKPDGDDSVIYEVVDDDSGSEDYISTVVRKSSIDSITNASNNASNTSDNSQNSSNTLASNSLIDASTIRELFSNTVQNRTSAENNSDNRIVINDRMSYIPRTNIYDNNVQNTLNNTTVVSRNEANENIAENSSNNQNQQTNFTISENTIASVLNQTYNTNSTSSYSQGFAETKKFDEILSPRNETTSTSSQQFVPARTPNRATTENSTKEYEQQEENISKTFDANTIINNNIDYDVVDSKTASNKVNINTPTTSTTANNQIVINHSKNTTAIETQNQNTENKIAERSEVLDMNTVEINEKSDIMNTANKNLANNNNANSQNDNQININAGSNISRNNNSTTDTSNNSWNIVGIDRTTSNTQEPSRTVRGSKAKPSIFLAQYDERLGNITIVPKERDMNRNTTLEEAILSLLEGAKEDEYNDNIISLISRNTSLLDLFVDDETVYLNFSDDFEFNPLGDEGIIVQIYQIVYTATQFEGINKVVFLIDGEHKEFLGSEGQILNKEFTRMEAETTIESGL